MKVKDYLKRAEALGINRGQLASGFKDYSAIQIGKVPLNTKAAARVEKPPLVADYSHLNPKLWAKGSETGRIRHGVRPIVP